MSDTKILEPVLLAALAKQGMVAGNVELRRDYAPRSLGKGYSPYARHYLDKISGKSLALVSALPGCDAYGQPHELGWMGKNGVIENGNNIFHCVIDKGTIRLIALSDQPAGAKKDDEVASHPQLFIDGAEVLPLSDMPELPETDPVNENYHNNVLEWDFGLCRRRIRLIEGRFLGSWVFVTPPEGDVLIRYNQEGKLRLKLQHAKDDDTEFVPKAFFDGAKEYPVTISDSATFYPDADPETSSVDGNVLTLWQDVDWSVLVNDTGSAAFTSDTYGKIFRIYSSATPDKWNHLYRSVFLFDTSGMPDGANISSAALSLYGRTYGKLDDLGIAPDVNIYSSAPASNTDLEYGDYDSLGSTPFSDTPVTYAGWATGQYNDFALNAAGIAAISKTGVSKFGARNANYDAANIAPSWNGGGNVSYLECYFSEQGTGYQPALAVVYTTGITEKSGAEIGSGAEAKTQGNPIVVTMGAETASGLESLGSRALGKTETGSGTESLGSRNLGKSETGSGLDVASLLAAFLKNETGSAAEAALRAVAILSGDTGIGSEISWMLKQALSGDSGAGADTLKVLRKIAGSSSDLRLADRAGQAEMPSKQFKTPFKGVNL